MIQVLKVMEKAGSRETGVVIDNIRDAFLEIESKYHENIETNYIDLVVGQKLYDLPEGFVMNSAIEISKTLTNYEDYQWTIQGRKLKILKKSYDTGEFIAPDEALTDGIAIVHTSLGMMFVYNPEGDATYYDYTSTGTETVLEDEIVYVLNGHASGGERYNYYKALANQASADLTTVDYSDTDTWENVTEIASPDEFSYINADENLSLAIIEFVKGKIAMSSDVNLGENYMKNFRDKANQAVVIRKGRGAYVARPKNKATSFMR
jgi:hypothetical protein